MLTRPIVALVVVLLLIAVLGGLFVHPALFAVLLLLLVLFIA
jgi:hypothetical protein